MFLSYSNLENKMNQLVRLRWTKSGASVLFNTLTRSVSTSQTLYAGYAKDYMPGPYPKTEVERIAAARKYRMR